MSGHTLIKKIATSVLKSSQKFYIYFTSNLCTIIETRVSFVFSIRFKVPTGNDRYCDGKTSKFKFKKLDILRNIFKIYKDDLLTEVRLSKGENSVPTGASSTTLRGRIK